MEYKCKNYRTCKKDYSWNPSTCICENGNCLKSIVDDSVIACDEIIYVYCINKCNKYCVNKLS